MVLPDTAVLLLITTVLHLGKSKFLLRESRLCNMPSQEGSLGIFLSHVSCSAKMDTAKIDTNSWSFPPAKAGHSVCMFDPSSLWSMLSSL